MVGKEVWGDVKSSALKKHLKYCKSNVCECLSTFFDKMLGGGSGLVERFARMMAPNAVRSGIPTHMDQIQGRQKAMQEAQRLYEAQGCGGPGAPQHAPISATATEYMGKRIPTSEDWEAEHGFPQPEGDYQPGQNNALQSPKDTGIMNAPLDSSVFDREYWENLTGLTGAALTAYLIISEGSRLFPPRNAVPIP